MFSRKQIIIKECDHETCGECGAKIDAINGVKVGDIYGNKMQFYCNSHRKPYDEFYLYQGTKNIYKRIRVDENGVPVGYKKIK